MRPLSQDLRLRIVAAREAGAGTGEVCRRFMISRSTAERLWNQHRQVGHVQPRQVGGHRKSRLEGHTRTLERWITRQTDMSLVEISERCWNDLGVRISVTALWHQLRRQGLSVKKNDARRRAKPA